MKRCSKKPAVLLMSAVFQIFQEIESKSKMPNIKEKQSEVKMSCMTLHSSQKTRKKQEKFMYGACKLPRVQHVL